MEINFRIKFFNYTTMLTIVLPSQLSDTIPLPIVNI